jgi:hypothetical protein
VSTRKLWDNSQGALAFRLVVNGFKRYRYDRPPAADEADVLNLGYEAKSQLPFFFFVGRRSVTCYPTRATSFSNCYRRSGLNAKLFLLRFGSYRSMMDIDSDTLYPGT